MMKLLTLVTFAAVALKVSAQENPFAWLLDLEQWGSKDEHSIQPSGIFDSCGGSLNLTSSLQVIEMGSFGPGTRCAWSIAMGLFNTLEVYTDTLNFEVGPSGLSVFSYAENYTYYLTRHKIPTGNQLAYSYPVYDVGFLTFTSTTDGSGFRLGVRGSGNLDNPIFLTGTHQFLGVASGTFKSHTVNYDKWERSSVVVQPNLNSMLEVRVTELDTKEGFVGMFIYTPPAYHTLSDDDDFRSFYGYHPFGPPGSTTNSTEPRFFMLGTDGTEPQTGFTLLWKNY